MLHDGVNAPRFEAAICRDDKKPSHGSAGSFFADAEKVTTDYCAGWGRGPLYSRNLRGVKRRACTYCCLCITMIHCLVVLAENSRTQSFSKMYTSSLKKFTTFLGSAVRCGRQQSVFGKTPRARRIAVARDASPQLSSTAGFLQRPDRFMGHVQPRGGQDRLAQG